MAYNEDMEGLEPMTPEEELEHYGRLGMEWYKHKFGRYQAQGQYAKAKELRAQTINKTFDELSKKTQRANEAQRKSDNAATRATAKYAKATRIENKPGFFKIPLVDDARVRSAYKKFERDSSRAAKQQAKASKNERSAEKLVKLINEYLGPIGINEITPGQYTMAQEYCIRLIDRMEKKKAS